MSLRRGFIVFLLLSSLVSFSILLASVNEKTIETFLSADVRGLFVALLLVFMAWCCDAARLCAVALAASERITFRLGLVLTWLHYFGCAVTPMQTGGGPFQVYVLYRGNIPIGKGVAITLTRTPLTMFILGISVTGSVIFEPGFISESHLLAGFFSYVVLFVIISWILVLISFIRPRMIKRWAEIITLLFRRFGLLQTNSVLKIIRRINTEIDNYNYNFRLFFNSGFNYFITGLLFSCLHLVFLFSVLPVLVWSLGLHVPYMQAFMAQSVFLFVLYFVPTPGASGFAEGGGAALFSLLMPWNIAGVMAVIWRFFTEYLAILMGSIVAVRMLGWGLDKDFYGKEMNDLDKET